MKKYYVAYEKNGTKQQTPKFTNREHAKHLANIILRSGIREDYNMQRHKGYLHKNLLQITQIIPAWAAHKAAQ